MPRQSVKDEQRVYEATLRNRLPAVKQASLALQARIGIEPETRVVGDLSVKAWEMPEPAWYRTYPGIVPVGDNAEHANDESEDKLLWYPPKDGKDGADEMGVEVDADSDIDADGDSEDGSISTRESLTCDAPDMETALSSPSQKLRTSQEITARKRALSPSTSSQQGPPTKLPRIVVDLTDSPVTQQASHSQTNYHSRSLDSAFEMNGAAPSRPPNLGATEDSRMRRRAAAFSPASPPQEHQSVRTAHSQSKLPIHWCSELSTIIGDWMCSPLTQAVQTTLLRLELRSSAPSSDAPLRLNAVQCEKMKITRMRLPPEAQSPLSPPVLLDWIVIEVVHKGNIESNSDDIEEDSMDEDDLGKHNHPYWVVAFPACAITASRVELHDVRVRPLAPSERVGMYWQTTLLALGKEARIPLVHGRGVSESIVDNFVNACAQGKGVIEMESVKAVPLEGV